MVKACPKTTMAKDKIIPIPLHEQNPSMGNIVINVGLVVRGRLDPERLKDALTTLIVKHWPELGARLRKDDKARRTSHSRRVNYTHSWRLVHRAIWSCTFPLSSPRATAVHV
ncbi:hypothetical protein BDZ89DRAFT_808628 [Hymenopellis radicata]|nr:hypothetical protein BDZ89DRAFT_808628 [Hymenopellis radicata]